VGLAAADLFQEDLFAKKKENFDAGRLRGKSVFLFYGPGSSQLDFYKNALGLARVEKIPETCSRVDYNVDMVSLWGQEPLNRCINKIRRFKEVLFIEDGFLKAVTNSRDDTIYSNGVCFFLDDLAFHFDGTKSCRAELMLNDERLVFSAEQKERARKIIEILHSNKLTKYNNQPIYTPKIGREGCRKVLVVEQSFDDWSVIKSDAGQYIFDKMLKDAIDENPDADIIIKTHPDPIARIDGRYLGGCYYAKVKSQGRIYKIDYMINPYSLLNMADKVYVCSSMMGMEALIAGKKVKTYGRPIYAGWGLTEDEQSFCSRTHTRSLEELVYVMYVLYAHYMVESKPCEVEDAIAYLLKLRQAYFAENKIRCEIGA